MADLEKTVAIIFEGVDRMGDGVNSATRKIDGLAGSVQSATQPLADATIGLAKFEGALIAGGAAATAFAVKLAGDFDTQFREIATLIGQPSEALGDFREELLAYGRESSQSLDQVNSAVYSAISAGIDYTDSLEAVRQAEQLAIAGKANLGESLTVLVSSLNAYGVGMEEAERFSDLLFQTVRSGQTTLPELGSSLANVTGLAATAGVSFDELLSAVATLTATGSSTSEAITQVRGAISNILKPTSQAKDLAADLGLEFNATALESKGFAGFMEDVGEATGGSTEKMSLLFGDVNALNGALTLTGLGAEKFAETILDMAGSAGATADAYGEMTEAIDNGSQRIQNAIKAAFVGFGTPLLDEFGSVQDAIAAIFNAIGASIESGQLSGFVDLLEKEFQGLEKTFQEVAQNLPDALEQADFSSFFDGIEALQDAVSNLFDGADLSSTDGLVSVIETLGLGFEALSQYVAGAIEGIGPFLRQLADLTQFFLELDPAVFAAAGTIGGLSIAINTLATAALTTTGAVRGLAGSGGVIAKGTPILKGMVSVLTGPLGLAAAAAAVGTAVYKAGEQFVDLNRDLKESRRAHSDLAEAVREGRQVWDYAIGDYVAAGEAQVTLQDRVNASQESLADWVRSLGETSTETERNERALRSAAAQYTNWDRVVEEASKSSESFNLAQEKNADILRDVLEAIGPLEDGWKRVADGVYENVINTAELENAYQKVADAFDEGLISEEQFKNLTDYYETLKSGADAGVEGNKDLADAALKTEKAILEERKAVLATEQALEEMASNENIKAMEFTAEIKVAEAEAEARKVEAVFNSIGTAVESTGETLSSMFGTLGQFDSRTSSGFRELEDIVQDEAKRRDKLINSQTKHLDAMTDNLKARTEALRNGDGLVKIDSTGLEPALEMILWEILEKIQLRANAEGQEFLLGLNSGSSV
ncbi:phage tail tape measure protein [Halomonas sp. M4R1S46]|uniref:phage tail tape measure protein n=1 Tax=Halomonas sp. M4R1S46 TaxID=2982692 RepID=UPI0021E4241B|nr:phage tail tape measure protein [Halomonas sp. M4R1S46]UYG08385.1 phage tail tape measure protein [Halomonas sp. M4R1S46]